MIAAGASGRVVAGAAGTYAYTCAYHPTMRAVLIVR
jgi:plastocyanin